MFSGCDSGAADLEGPRRRLWVLSHSSVTGPCHGLAPAGCWPCPWSSGPGRGMVSRHRNGAGAQRRWWTWGCGAGRGLCPRWQLSPRSKFADAGF